MKIDFVVIASDNNPLYYDFYPVVSRQWNCLGYKVFFINISDEDSCIEETDYGLIKKVKSIAGIPTGFQAQVVRFYAPTLLKENNFLLSDIDMLPLNGTYYFNEAEKIPNDQILIYSGQPYTTTPFYPVCYILGNGAILKNIMQIDGSYENFISKMAVYSNLDWNTDEKYFYNAICKNPDKATILKDRDFKRRIDRGNWTYSIEKLNSGYYIDSHLLRPYIQYKNDIDRLRISL